MSEEPTARTTALEAASRRRIELKEAVSATEVAAALPAGDPNTRDRLLRALDDLSAAWDQHAEAVEGDDGLLAELTQVAPRLVGRVTALEAEHPVVRNRIVEVAHAVKEGIDLAEVRDAALDVLVTIARHRQKGADLVYDGYNVDIGGH